MSVAQFERPFYPSTYDVSSKYSLADYKIDEDRMLVPLEGAEG